MANDAPLYSKATGLPIYRVSDDVPIYGDPADCGCCGGGGPFDDACGNCPGRTTPLKMEVTFSGITACTFCQFGGWGGNFYWKPTAAPNGTFELTRDPDDPCLFTAETTWGYNRYAENDDDCNGASQAQTAVAHIELVRVSLTQWELTVWGEWPDFPPMGLMIFLATVTADCDAEWSAGNIYNDADSCTTLPPQGTIAFYGGTVTARPIDV